MVFVFQKNHGNFSTLSSNDAFTLIRIKVVHSVLLDYSVSLSPDKFNEFPGNVPGITGFCC